MTYRRFPPRALILCVDLSHIEGGINVPRNVTNYYRAPPPGIDARSKNPHTVDLATLFVRHPALGKAKTDTRYDAFNGQSTLPDPLLPWSILVVNPL
jgi:hypothetical protein